MEPSVRSSNKKKVNQPVIVTTNKFTPKVSERTRRKRQEAKENKYKRSRFASGLNLCGFISLYVLLIVIVLIGAGGIAVCAIYFNTDSSTQGWKIAGIALGCATCIVGIILIILTIVKQTRNRRWVYKKQDTFNLDDQYGDLDDDSETSKDHIANSPVPTSIITRYDSPVGKRNVSQSSIIHSSSNAKTRETATSPIGDQTIETIDSKTISSDLIFCPGCNRLHPSTHQCMYQTHVANGFSTRIPSVSHPPRKDSIAIQTEDSTKKTKKTLPHTTIDRTIKYSNTTETQTEMSTNPRSNITESIILRRVPIPTTKVVVQQPTTKVMIVKVPNTAGQLVIQPKVESIDEIPD